MANNTYILNTRNLIAESSSCLSKFHLPHTDNLLLTRDSFLDSRKIRYTLRDLEFQKWCGLPQKGKGVILFSEHSPANRWVTNHKGLSCSEWRDALKMISYVPAVHAIPGRTMNDNRCRHCHNEIETLPHVLGSCPYGETLRNARHHKIRSTIAQALRKNNFTVYEEVHGISECGSNRRVDILAFKDNQRGFIIDPTVRFECSSSQPEAVHEEKCAIYQPTVPYYLTKYKLQSITVIGLLVGARGTITKRFTQFVKDFNLHPSLSQHVCLIAIKYSVYLLRNHIYNK